MVVALLALHWLRVSLISATQLLSAAVHKENGTILLSNLCAYACVCVKPRLPVAMWRRTDGERDSNKESD